MDDSIDKSKIFIWGQVGERLKKLDKERLFAIAQQDPDYYLSVLANIDIDTLIEILLASTKDKPAYKSARELILDEKFTCDLPPGVLSSILKINKLDNLYREISGFMKDSNDMLSIGSFLTGEIDKKTAMLYLGRRENDKNG